MKAREIAELVGGQLHGDGDTEITSVADIKTAATGQLSFYEKDGTVPETTASCVITHPGRNASVNERGSDETGTQAETRPVGRVSLITVANPKLAFAKAASKILAWESRLGWHETAVIPPQNPDDRDIRADYIGANVSIGEGTYIGEGAIIHDGVRIGRNVVIKKFSILHPNCVIYDNVEIGDSSILHAGVVIGADGFGYVKDENGEYIKFPQIGTVVIEDNVEIGASTCIDRGPLGETRIGEGTKIDNLVQVGHNVSIGKRCVIAPQTGISGSVTIEDDCVIGGQVGFGDHVTVKSGAVIGSQAGVLPGKIVRPGIWWGTPIQPLDEYKHQNPHIKALERLRKDVKTLMKRLSNAEQD